MIGCTVPNDKGLISVIVPVYKAEQYLRRCVDSILAQTYANLEIILVDDGSPDSSGVICDEYAAKDSRIRVIHKENGGVSSARNMGMDICKGDYVAFVDSDDYILPEMYDRMLMALLERNADMSVCQWQYEYVDGRHPITQKLIDQSIYDVTSSRELARFIFKKVYDAATMISPCNKLYKRYIVHEARFHGRYMEDQVFHVELFSKDFPVHVIPDLLYVYVENPDSLTHSSFGQKELRFLDVLKICYARYSDDPFMCRESMVRYCNIYIEYYFKSKELGLAIPNRTHFVRCVQKLIQARCCNLKFFIRMLLFFLSPKLYHTLLMK